MANRRARAVKQKPRKKVPSTSRSRNRRRRVEVRHKVPRPAPRPGSHPRHPRCQACGHALYKTMFKGKSVRREDGWNWCRSPACRLFNQDLSKLAPAQVAGPREVAS